MSSISNALYQKALQLIILPTEKCNFRCTYCYETFEIGKMKPPTVSAIKKLIEARIERKSLEHLNLSWFGGEPLLAKDVVLDISEFAKKLYDQGSLVSYTGDVTTNAYLLKPDLLARLVNAHQKSFQISLDGFGAGHDVTRKYASGAGTFEVIWPNLLAAKATELDFRITLRCHLTRENESSMSELIDNICERFGGDQRFSVFFKTIENLGGPNASTIGRVDGESAHARVQRMEQKLRNVGLSVTAVLEGPESNTGKATSVGPGTELQAVEQKLVDSSPQAKLAAYSGYVCYAAKPNSLMIRADGTIGKCTVLLDDPRNKVGTLNPDGTVTIDSALVSGVWMRGFVSLDATELGCPAMNLPKVDKPAIVSLKNLTRKVAPDMASA